MVSLNVNSDRRVELPGPTRSAFEEFDLDHRYPTNERFLETLIHEEEINCFALQEIDPKALGMLSKTFERQGFKWITTPYCLDSGAFSFMFAYDPKKIEVRDVEQCYYTASGLPTTDAERKSLSKDEKFKRHLEVEFEKSAQVFTLHTLDDGKNYCVANTQPGLTNKHRLLAMHKLVDFIETRPTRVAETQGTILVGDMNQFDDRVAEARSFMDQIHVLTEAGYCWDSESLGQEGAKSTFFGFPYDIFRFLSGDEKTRLKELEVGNDPIALRRFYLDKCQTLSLWGACLDAVYTRGQVSAKDVQAYTFFGGKLVNVGKTDPEELQTRILSAMHKDEVKSDDQEPTDHMALVFKVR